MKITDSNIINVEAGENLQIINPVNIYDCVIGDNVFIGPFVEIQKGVKINSNTRIQSHSFICELVEIGKNCFIGHGVMFINDKFSYHNGPSGDKNLWEKNIIRYKRNENPTGFIKKNDTSSTVENIDMNDLNYSEIFWNNTADRMEDGRSEKK